MKIKICGIKRIQDADCALKYGADFLGLIFTMSPRQISFKEAWQLVKTLNQHDRWVGVFKNEPVEKVALIAENLGLQWLQFHGYESPYYCEYFLRRGFKIIKTVSSIATLRNQISCLDQFALLEANKYDVMVPSFLNSIRYLEIIKCKRWFLSGGLQYSNLEERLKMLDGSLPYGIDIARGSEKELGVKDPILMKGIIQKIKQF